MAEKIEGYKTVGVYDEKGDLKHVVSADEAKKIIENKIPGTGPFQIKRLI